MPSPHLPWFRVDAAVTRHPKTLRLAARLGISQREAIGLLVQLWSWTATYAPSGRLASDTDTEAMRLEVGDRELAALTDCDWVEMVEGALVVRNFNDRNGSYLRKLQRDAEWKRSRRAAVAQPSSQPLSEASEQPLSPTGRDGTVRNRKNTIARTSKPSRAPRAPESQLFVRFYDSYPRKVGRDAAWREWERIRKANPEVDLRTIIESAEDWAEHWELSQTEAQFIPHPRTWLHQGRWKDQPPTTNGAPS